MKQNIYDKENISHEGKRERGKIIRALARAISCYSYHSQNARAPHQRKRIISLEGKRALARAHSLLKNTYRKNSPSTIHNLARFRNEKVSGNGITSLNQDSERRKNFIALKYGEKYKTLSMFRKNELLGIKSHQFKKEKSEFWKDFERRKKCSSVIQKLESVLF